MTGLGNREKQKQGRLRHIPIQRHFVPQNREVFYQCSKTCLLSRTVLPAKSSCKLPMKGKRPTNGIPHIYPRRSVAIQRFYTDTSEPQPIRTNKIGSGPFLRIINLLIEVKFLTPAGSGTSRCQENTAMCQTGFGNATVSSDRRHRAIHEKPGFWNSLAWPPSPWACVQHVHEFSLNLTKGRRTKTPVSLDSSACRELGAYRQTHNPMWRRSPWEHGVLAAASVPSAPPPHGPERTHLCTAASSALGATSLRKAHFPRTCNHKQMCHHHLWCSLWWGLSDVSSVWVILVQLFCFVSPETLDTHRTAASCRSPRVLGLQVCATSTLRDIQFL